MQTSHVALILAMLCSPIAGLGWQSAPAGDAQAPASQADASPAKDAPHAPTQDADPPPSGLLQPSLNALEQAVEAVRLEKWKGNAARAEADSNIRSIEHDLESTLPKLLKEADSAPSSVSKVLPVSTNVDALYDVVLRVVNGARIAAPPDQFSPLQQAMAGLEKARHSLDDHMLETAAAGEKQVVDLQVALKKQSAVVCPAVPPPAPALAPAAKKKPAVRKKPKPATPPAPNSQPATTPKPNP